MSGLALGVLAMGGFIAMSMSMSGGGGALKGAVHPLAQSVSAVVLQDTLTSTLENAGSSVDRLECPADSKVGQGLVTVCHGSVDGFDWTGVVVFEDDGGAFIVTEY
ncbi:hypothetical protein BJ986_001233 [Phycicoccus badiiscoriae]|uniref:DUF4333 domain-containing protein n=1 Tax=Pedococcus badiiscoriae TaxID=642776 RepID=A0A852WMV7_9MICO|nr:hypothetical protein [Pedococcus badiiscoriae]NYG06746.1 hypothetical protein [Pedococcus badiiscoriae]